MRFTTQRESARTNAGTTLWVIQGLLALLFLFAGSMKLYVPADALAKMTPLPGPFMRFIGVAEVLGGFGLILPGFLRIRPDLTSLAASGLVIIMSGATVVTLALGQRAPALMPLVVGLLAAFVAYERWEKAPSHNSSYRSTQPAN